MLRDCKQGDIFKFGHYGDYQLILVFAPHGMHLGGVWRNFKRKHQSLESIKSPYDELSTPFEYEKGRWIQFLESSHGTNGMDDAEFEQMLTKSLDWSVENGIRTIITTGIRDLYVNKDDDTERIKLTKEICSRIDYDQLEITLISRDRSYTNDKHSPYNRSFLPEPDCPEPDSETKIIAGGNESDYEQKINSGEISLLKEFHIFDSVYPMQMKYTLLQMQKTLDALTEGAIPNDKDYSNDDLLKYCQSLATMRYHLGKKPPLPFYRWALTLEIRDVPHELKQDAVFQPHIVAVCTLSRILLDFPEIALKTDGFARALRSGLTFLYRNRTLSIRNDNFFANINSMHKSGVFEVMHAFPNLLTERAKIFFQELSTQLKRDLDCGYIERTEGSYFAKKCQLALEMMPGNTLKQS